MVSEIFSTITVWYLDHINYATVTLLMAVESSFIPFPSEIVVPPAAYKAAQGTLNIIGVLISSTIGALIGALFNYFFALFVGRKAVYVFADSKVAHFFLINRRSIEKAENYFLKHGCSSTFIGRFIPAIRQLISLPAGIAKMDLKLFLFYTILGSGIWNIILCLLGYFLYSQRSLLERYYNRISMVFILLGIAFVGYLVYNGLKNGEKKEINKKIS